MKGENCCAIARRDARPNRRAAAVKTANDVAHRGSMFGKDTWTHFSQCRFYSVGGYAASAAHRIASGWRQHSAAQAYAWLSCKLFIYSE